MVATKAVGLRAENNVALNAGLRTLDVGSRALSSLRRALERLPLSEAFLAAADLIAATSGRVIVTGMGKSGLVGRKIAATLASTGTPAFFIHPAEASHGDLGMITGNDIVLALSWSGETNEVSDILSYCRTFEVPLVVMTSRGRSTLGRAANVVLLLPQVEEACPNRLTPTSSTLLQSVLGDALAMALIDAKGFSADQFKIFHPKGSLGAQLLRVGDIMSVAEAIPVVPEDATILSAMLEMSQKRFGITGVLNDRGCLVGGFSDGDLRRALTIAPVDASIRHHMTINPLTVDHRELASEALAVMNGNNVLQLFVTDDAGLAGIVHVHDILRAGVI